MKKKSIVFKLISLFLIFSIGLQSSNFLGVQPYIATNVNKKIIIASSWSKATVISDDSTFWNDGYGENPNLAVDNDGKIHVAWSDDTDGEWGTDYEIMYVKYTASKPQDLGFLLLLLGMQQPADYTLIFIGIGAAAAVVIIIIVIKKKE